MGAVLKKITGAALTAGLVNKFLRVTYWENFYRAGILLRVGGHQAALGKTESERQLRYDKNAAVMPGIRA